MSENTTIPGIVIDETVEIIATTRFARLKNIALNPMIVTAAVSVVGAGIVLIAASRKPLEVDSEDV